MHEKPLWVKAGEFGWIRTDSAGFTFENVEEDMGGRDSITFTYKVDGKEHGPFTSIAVLGSQPG